MKSTRFAAISNRVRSLFLKSVLVNMVAEPITEIAVVAVLAILILLVSAQYVSLSMLVAFIALLYRLQPRVALLVSAQSSLASLHASIAVIRALLEREPAPLPPPAGTSAPVKGRMAFRQVTFGYPNGVAPVIRELLL